MKSLLRLSAIAAIATSIPLASLAQASGEAAAAQKPKGKYTVMPPRLYSEQAMARTSSLSLQTWNGSFSYGGSTYTYNMVGAAPSSNTSASVPVYIIPVKIVVGRRNRQSTFDPAHVLSNGKSVTQNTVDSPLFTSSVDYKLGSVDVGSTQYIDAYQRANFWGTVSSHTSSHLLLGGPTVVAEQTLTVPTNYGKTGSPFGFTAGLVDINWFDAQLPNIMAAEGIQPNAFAIFLTYDVYLTQGGSCCIGGYHSAEGSASNPQSYAEATYVDRSGVFSQDVSALSHEIGEWADDPLVANPNGNQTPCGILENGDPLENTANYGDYAYTQNGYTYHLQDLVMLPYFGAPASTSANGWFSFHNASLSVCSNGS
ncbi:MAG TPA: hypothetical protein VF126_07745 [Acidobacteriaceae bacterium]